MAQASVVKIATMAVEGKIKAVFSNDKTFPFTAEGWKELIDESNGGRAKGKLVMNIVP
jgi:NADPH:quinone reductase-like Zn-dependent oxidoreductase